MNNEVAAFLAFLKDERQLSDNTLMSYQRDLEQTVTYLEDRGIVDWQQVDHYLLIDLLNSLRQQGKANSTINRVISSLRQFCKYMIRHHNLTINQMEMIFKGYFSQIPRSQYSIIIGGTIGNEMEVSDKIEKIVLKTIGKEIISTWDKIVYLMNKILLLSVFLEFFGKFDVLTVRLILIYFDNTSFYFVL